MRPTIHPDAPLNPEPPRRVAAAQTPGGAKSECSNPTPTRPRWGQIKAVGGAISECYSQPGRINMPAEQPVAIAVVPAQRLSTRRRPLASRAKPPFWAAVRSEWVCAGGGSDLGIWAFAAQSQLDGLLHGAAVRPVHGTVADSGLMAVVAGRRSGGEEARAGPAAGPACSRYVVRVILAELASSQVIACQGASEPVAGKGLTGHVRAGGLGVCPGRWGLSAVSGSCSAWPAALRGFGGLPVS